MKVDRDSYAFKLAERELIGDLNLEDTDFNAFRRQSDAVEFILQQLLLQRTKNMGGYTAVQFSEMKTSTYLGIPALELADNIVTKNRTVVDCDTYPRGLWYDQKLAAEITAIVQRGLSSLSDYQQKQILNCATNIPRIPEFKLDQE